MSETTTQPPKIHAALIGIMRAIAPIAKDQHNQQQNYKFRGIDQVYNAVHPHFAQHGVYSTSEILSAEHKQLKSEKGKDYVHAIFKVRFTFWAEDGSHVTTEVVSEGIDYGGDKASNKAMSTADKYAILQLLKIPTAARDNDGGGNGRMYADWVTKAAAAIEDARDEARIAQLRGNITNREATPGERKYLEECMEQRTNALRGKVPATNGSHR